MDKFDLKKYLTEGKILKEDTTQYEPFVEGETTLIRSLLYEERYDLGYRLENQEEYDFLIKNGPLAFETEYLDGESVGDFVKENRFNEREEYSVGNDMNSYNLTPISENKSTNQIKEDTTKYEPFVEGQTVLRRTEDYNLKKNFEFVLDNEEQYNYLIKNGVKAFLRKFEINEFDEFDLENDFEKLSSRQYSLGDNEFDDNLTPISENKSTTQLKEYKIK